MGIAVYSIHRYRFSISNCPKHLWSEFRVLGSLTMLDDTDVQQCWIDRFLIRAFRCFVARSIESRSSATAGGIYKDRRRFRQTLKEGAIDPWWAPVKFLQFWISTRLFDWHEPKRKYTGNKSSILHYTLCTRLSSVRRRYT